MLENQTIVLIAVIIFNTIASIIGAIKGDKKLIATAEKKKQKALAKLEKKHKKTEEQFLKEEKQINLLKNKEK